MIGYQFMGRAHSNAWRQVSRFFDTPLEPVMKVVCGRNQAELEKAATQLGWQECATHWQRTSFRARTSTSSTSAHPAIRTCRLPLLPRPRGKSCFARSRSPTRWPRLGEMLAAVQKAPACSTCFATTIGALPPWCWPRKSSPRDAIGSVHHYRGTYLQDWIVIWTSMCSAAPERAQGRLRHAR